MLTFVVRIPPTVQDPITTNSSTSKLSTILRFFGLLSTDTTTTTSSVSTTTPITRSRSHSNLTVLSISKRFISFVIGVLPERISRSLNEFFGVVDGPKAIETVVRKERIDEVGKGEEADEGFEDYGFVYESATTTPMTTTATPIVTSTSTSVSEVATAAITSTVSIVTSALVALDTAYVYKPSILERLSQTIQSITQYFDDCIPEIQWKVINLYIRAYARFLFRKAITIGILIEDLSEIFPVTFQLLNCVLMYYLMGLIGWIIRSVVMCVARVLMVFGKVAMWVLHAIGFSNEPFIVFVSVRKIVLMVGQIRIAYRFLVSE